MAITWRNVQGRDESVAATLLRDAGNSIGRGIDSFRNILNESRATADSNMETQREANTDTFLDALQRFGSEDELDEAVSSGQLDELRDSLGPLVDRDVLRGAVDSRRGALREEDARRSRSNTDQLIADVVREAGSFGEARAAFTAVADEAGLSAGDQLGAMERLEQSFYRLHGLDRDQQGRLAVQNENILREADTEKQITQTQWADAQSRFRVDENFSFSDDRRVELGDVISQAEDRGWDTSNASAAIRDVANEFAAQNDLNEEETLALPRLMEMVVSSMGSPGDNFFSNNDLDDIKDQIYDTLNSTFEAYQINVQNRVRRNAAEQAYIQSMAQIDARASQRMADALQTERAINENIRSVYNR